jgi:hypothetical protein
MPLFTARRPKFSPFARTIPVLGYSTGATRLPRDLLGGGGGGVPSFRGGQVLEGIEGIVTY